MGSGYLIKGGGIALVTEPASAVNMTSLSVFSEGLLHLTPLSTKKFREIQNPSFVVMECVLLFTILAKSKRVLASPGWFYVAGRLPTTPRLGCTKR